MRYCNKLKCLTFYFVYFAVGPSYKVIRQYTGCYWRTIRRTAQQTCATQSSYSGQKTSRSRKNKAGRYPTAEQRCWTIDYLRKTKKKEANRPTTRIFPPAKQKRRDKSKTAYNKTLKEFLFRVRLHYFCTKIFNRLNFTIQPDRFISLIVYISPQKGLTVLFGVRDEVKKEYHQYVEDLFKKNNYFWR